MHATPGDILSVLETLASEQPEVVPTVVATLASSPARSALLELVPLFQVKAPAEIAAAAVAVARQLDRLERRPRWTEPRDVFGDTAASATVLDAFARRRADRWRSTRGGIRPARLVRVDRRLRNAAGLERARALVDGFLWSSALKAGDPWLAISCGSRRNRNAALAVAPSRAATA